MHTRAFVPSTLVGLLCCSAAYADPPSGTEAQVPVGSSPIPTVTFAQAVQAALDRNPSAAIAREEIHRARAVIEQVRAASLPTLQANVVYTRLDANRVLNGQVVAAANQISANASLLIPLVATQHWAQWSQALESERVVRALADDSRRQVASAVARAYLSLVSQHRIVASFERAQTNARDHLSFAHERFAGGIGIRLDEVRAAQEVAADASLLTAQRLLLAREQEALGVLLAVDGPVDVSEDIAAMPIPSLDAARRDAPTHRADVRLSEAHVNLARHARRDSWADYMPTLFGQFQPFFQDPPTLTTPVTGWQALLTLNVALYDGGLRYGLHHERQALEREAEITAAGTLRQAQSEVRTAFDELRLSDDAARAAHEAARLAEDARALTVLAYRQGATTNIEVIDAERRARDAEAAAEIADDGARQARMDILVASGHFP